MARAGRLSQVVSSLHRVRKGWRVSSCNPETRSCGRAASAVLIERVPPFWIRGRAWGHLNDQREWTSLASISHESRSLRYLNVDENRPFPA